MVSLLPCLLSVWLPIIAAAHHTYTPCDTCTDRASTSELAKISFRFFPENTFEGYTSVLADSATDLLNYIDLSKPTVLYVAGWTESMDSISVQTVLGAYFTRGDNNVLLLDYEEIASGEYLYVYQSVDGVGWTAARGLNDLVAAGFDSSNLHIVGHSMGAQVAGFIGKSTDFTVPRITGLDPAGPGFYTSKDHLKASDAGFVTVIHTDAWGYGNALADGTVDIYPNFGSRIQPGCPVAEPLTNDDFCSHFRSWYYYAESLLDKSAFAGTACSHNLIWITHNCDSDETVAMDLETLNVPSGKYYFQTNSESPFGRGTSGATFNLTLYLSTLSF